MTNTIQITEIRTIAVPVADQDRALDFYVGKLGFEKRLDAVFGGDRRWIEVAPSGSATTLALAPLPQGGVTGIDTGIRIATPDADADHDALLARGVDADPEVLHFEGAPPMFSLRDPDGNQLYVVEHRTLAERSGRTLKRFAVLVKSNAEIEEGAMPTEDDLAAMARFNDELVESDVMLAGEGLHASADGARLVYTQGEVSVQRGPFPEPESLVAGYWIIQTGSLDEAIELMKRAPLDGGSVEIRQIFDAEDFGEELTPELREREERQRTMMEENARRRAA